MEFEGRTFGRKLQGCGEDEVRNLEDDGIGFNQRGGLEVLVSVHAIHKALVKSAARETQP